MTALKLVDVDRVRRRGEGDRPVPVVKHDLAAAAPILGELQRVGRAARSHVHGAALGDVVDRHGLPAANCLGRAARERAVTRQRRVHQLFEVGERGKRGEVTAVLGSLQPFALEQLRRGRAGDAAIERLAAVDVHRAPDPHEVDAHAFEGYAAPTALAFDELHVDLQGFAFAHD